MKERDIVYRKLSANVPGMIYQFMRKPDGNYCAPFTTDAIKDIFGCSSGDVVNDFSPIAKVIYPDDFERLIDSIEESARKMSHWKCEFRVQIPGKPLRWLLGNSTPEKQLADGSIIWHGFCTDITERKLTEAALQERDAAFRKLSAHVPGAIYQFVRKPDGTYHLPFSSDTIKKIFGYSPQELANDFSLVTNAILPEDMDGFISTIEYSAQHMTDWKYEYRIQLPGEAVRWMLGQSTPEKLPDGSIIWHGFNADITEQKETQENLKISQENYKRLFDEHSAVKLLIDPETGNIMDANYAAVAFYGWTRDEIKQMKIWQINTLSEQEVKHEMNNALKKKKLHFEFRHRLADGSIRNVEVYSSKIKINGRDVLHSIIHDSTDRKQIEEALVKSELKFKRLFENSPVGVFMLKDRIIIDVNPALCNITGYSPEEIVGNSVRIIYANDEEFERAGSSVYEQVFKNGIGSIEAQLIRKNGDIFYGLLFLTQIDPRDSSFGYEGIMVDIDERKRADEKLKLEQQRFKSLTESSSDIIFVLNTEGIITYVNPAIEKGLGYKPEERIGKYGLEFVHPDDLQSVNSKFNILVNSTKYSILHTEDRMRHKDGSWRIFEATGNNLIKDNVVEAIIIRLHDITERKEKDQELFETKERYRILFEDSPDPYLILGNGKILDCNRSAEKMFLCSREKLIGTSPDQFSPEFQPNGRPSNEAAKEIIEKTLQKGLCTFEWTHTRMDGSDFPVEVSASTMVMDGRIVLLGVFRDITERKHAENALRVSEEKYRGIFDESIAAIYIFDSKKNFIDSNQAGLDLLGYSREELLHISIPDVDADPVVVRPAHQELFDGGRLINFEHKLRRKDGSIVNVINNSRPLTDSQGNTIGMLSTLIDITERKRAEAEIAVLSNALKLALDPILILDLEGKIINVNEAAKKLFETEDLGVSALDYVAPEDKEKVTVTMQALLMGSSVNIAEFTVITKSGRRVFIEATGNLIVDENGKATGLVVVERDITERKRMEESLLQEQQFSKSVLDNLPEIFYLFTYPENRLKLGNKQVEMLLGFNTEETIGRHVTEWIVPEYRDAVLKAIDEVMEKGRNSIEAPLLTKDGHQIPFFLTGAKFVVDDQSYFMGIGMELTERKKAEEALLDSETKLKAVIQGSPVPQFVIDKNHKILYWNKALEEISGIKSADVLGTNKHWHAFYTHERPCLADLLVDEKINLIPELYKGKYNESNYVDGAYEAEDFFPVIGKWLFFGAALIRDAHGNIIGALETLEDTTERKQAEKDLEKYREHLEELVRERTIHLEASNKELEAFSYSASHDLRAPLRSIEGFSQALLEDYEDKLNTHGKDYLTRIKMATRRMADLIEDMLQLSRITRMEMNIEKVNLTAVANSVISDLQKSQPQRNVKVKIAEGMDDHADSRLSRIIMDNLLRNAWKFTEKQANATIEFGLWKKEDEIKVYFVRDNGAGFDMAYADKLFAPFQRLHADDEFPGTGIGLATVRRILNRHGGRIWAEGETGKGATFYFSFSEK
ncbi:response regulator receiver sensor signal transduction histidine kinase [Smithella sp. ME-1]|nr:response regulator receiver sensor signal transduction histidine kinase [Smithella sp. ME-1]